MVNCSNVVLDAPTLSKKCSSVTIELQRSEYSMLLK